MTPRLEVAALTDPGKVRPHNEDCIAADGHAGTAVLADGMGGHNAGEVASRLAVELVSANLKAQALGAEGLDAIRAENLVAAQIAQANWALLDASHSDPAYEGMGTTLVAAVWHREGVTYGHVGDSRLYVLRGNEMRQLTRDHSIVQEQLEQGAISAEQARYAPHRNVLTRAVGIDLVIEAEVRTWRAEPDDVYLLCSDGLTDMLTDEEIRETLLESGSCVDAAAERLVERANANGGLDNISVILVRVLAREAAR